MKYKRNKAEAVENTDITLRNDKELKKQALKDQGISFIVSREYNAETIKAIENVRNRQNLSRGFSSVQELMEGLNADD